MRAASAFVLVLLAATGSCIKTDWAFGGDGNPLDGLTTMLRSSQPYKCMDKADFVAYWKQELSGQGEFLGCKSNMGLDRLLDFWHSISPDGSNKVIVDVGANLGFSVARYLHLWCGVGGDFDKYVRLASPEIDLDPGRAVECAPVVGGINKTSSASPTACPMVFAYEPATSLFIPMTTGLSALLTAHGVPMDRVRPINKGAGVQAAKQWSGTQQVVRLGDERELYEADQIDLLKIDAEGEDPMALEGAKELLRKSLLVVFEYNDMGSWRDTTLQKVTQQLTDQSFDSFWIGASHLVPLYGSWWDPAFEVKKRGYVVAIRQTNPIRDQLLERFNVLHSICPSTEAETKTAMPSGLPSDQATPPMQQAGAPVSTSAPTTTPPNSLNPSQRQPAQQLAPNPNPPTPAAHPADTTFGQNVKEYQDLRRPQQAVSGRAQATTRPAASSSTSSSTSQGVRVPSRSAFPPLEKASHLGFKHSASHKQG